MPNLLSSMVGLLGSFKGPGGTHLLVRLALPMKEVVDIRSSATRGAKLTQPQQISHGEDETPRAGDVILVRIEKPGHHSVIELLDGVEHPLVPGEVAAVALGRRYATGEFHGEVPEVLSGGSRLDLLNIGGIVGQVKSSTSTRNNPTTLIYLGSAVDEAGKKISTFDSPPLDVAGEKRGCGDAAVLLVVGSAMDVGKTTAASTAIQRIREMGYPVGGAKLTGTSRMKDILKMKQAGAEGTVDFLDAGYPSTFGCSREELEVIFASFIDYFARSGVSIVVMEVADGVFQRETEIVLSSSYIMKRIRGIIAAAPDSLAAFGMIKYLSDIFDLVPDFIAGIITSAPLSTQELKKRVSVPFLDDSAESRERFFDFFHERFSSCLKG
jgi:hypothetical protein